MTAQLGMFDLAEWTVAEPDPPKVDVQTDGYLYLVRPENAAANEWLHEHTDGQWFGGALVVESRYIYHLCDGMAQDGVDVWFVNGPWDYDGGEAD